MAGYPVVVKAQVQVGGRGKAGGIKLADNADEVRLHAGNILGLDIKGHIVKRVWVEHASDIAEGVLRQLLARSLGQEAPADAQRRGRRRDRGRGREQPRRHRQDLHIDPVDGITLEEAPRRRGRGAKIDAEATDGVVDMLVKLYRAYTEGDCDLARSTRSSSSPDGGCTRSTPRSPRQQRRVPPRVGRVPSHRGARRARAARPHDKGLQYVGLDGTVGIIANGAGLAMSTLDVVNQVGGKPANFLDIGGGANADMMAGALEVINNDPNVKSIFINIFGGITKGDEVAKGIVEALGRVKIDAPIVIRLDGTNAEEGREILANAGIPETSSSKPTMLEAARAGQVSPRRRKRTDPWPSSSTRHQGRSYQGLTGSQGRSTACATGYGTQVVAGVNPKKAGTDVDGIPVYATRWPRPSRHRRHRVRFIPAPGRAASAACSRPRRRASEHRGASPRASRRQDEANFFNKLKRDFPGTRLLGPNCPGIISPGKCNIGITAGEIAKPGGQRSGRHREPLGHPHLPGALRAQAPGHRRVHLRRHRWRPGARHVFIDCLEAFEADPETKAVMLIGEIGGSAEEEAAEFIKAKMTKPVSAYIAGVTAPPGKKMGHAGAIVSGGKGTAARARWRPSPPPA
jgi:succinyl-CoA synthetase beta subunit